MRGSVMDLRSRQLWTCESGDGSAFTEVRSPGNPDDVTHTT